VSDACLPKREQLQNRRSKNPEERGIFGAYRLGGKSDSGRGNGQGNTYPRGKVDLTAQEAEGTSRKTRERGRASFSPWVGVPRGEIVCPEKKKIEGREKNALKKNGGKNWGGKLRGGGVLIPEKKEKIW